MTTIISAVDLWRSLCSGAGLELRLKGGKPGRDADIEATLRTALEVPESAASLEAWLMRDGAAPKPTVTIERFLVEVLNSQSGFALMMQGILEVLNAAQAQQSRRPLSVSFKFDEVSDPIKETLKQFQEATIRTQRTLESRPLLPNLDFMWVVWRVFDDLARQRPHEWPEAFASVGTMPTTGHDLLDTQLARVGQLVAGFLDLWLSYGATREKVRRAAEKVLNRADGNVLFGQLNAATDYWDHQTLLAANAVAQKVIAGQLDAEDVAEKLSSLFSRIEWGEVWVEHTVRELLDILNLPTWKRRHELYSVWVGTRMLQVVENVAADVHFHPVEGVLSFEFGGSRLASYSWNGQQFDVWAELRSALIGRSGKRKREIQPDFRIVRASLEQSTGARTTYVLECKHYLNASTSNFTQAATDYARSCPSAAVHVVNHGPADGVALSAALPAELRSRTQFIGDATPSLEAVSGGLGEAILKTLFPDAQAATTNASSQDALAAEAIRDIGEGCVGYITLEWDASLDDMDLALWVIGPDGTRKEAFYFGHQGSLGSAPFIRFNEDIRNGPGSERIDVGAWHFDRYELVATNYSETGRMSPESLHCRVVTQTSLSQIDCPAGLPAGCHEWRIAQLHVSGDIMQIQPFE